MITAIYIDNERLDLFKDESISVNSSVLDIQDITKNTTEYSNSFTVPASHTNNVIFKHYYNTDIDNAFDARVAVTARIELGGLLFREGKITLQKVIVKKGLPSSYMINFYGLLVSLKETFGTDKLSDLSFSTFSYEADSIKNLLTNGSNTDLTCCLFSNRKYFYEGNTNDFDETIEGNLWYDATALSKGGIYWKELKPSYLITSILDAIETKYSLNITGGFFSDAMFDNMYMLLDNGTEMVTNSVETALEVDLTAGPYNWIYATYIEVNIAATYTYDIIVQCVLQTGYTDAECIFRFYNNGVLIEQVETIGGIAVPITLDALGVNKLTYTVEAKQTIQYKTNVDVKEYISAVLNTSEFAGRAVADEVVATYDIAANMPDLTILDFFKGLTQLFKLVLIPTSETDIYINNVEDYYSEGSIIDLTKYVNTNQIEVSRGELLNKIIFEFQSPTTILNKQFKGTTEEGYGDEKLYIYDSSNNLIDGSSNEIKPPFEQVVYERLLDINDNTNTNIQYGGLIDENLGAINIKPHIHYAILRSIGSQTIAFNDGSISELNNSYWSPSHIASQSAFGTGLIFGTEQDEYSKLNITTNLYTEYYATYISNLFNIKRRNYTLKSNDVPLNILTDIKLNDVVKIGIGYYRIDKMDINITTGEIKFNLFNVLELGL